MGDMTHLTHKIEAVPNEDAVEFWEFINKELGHLSHRQKALLLMMGAVAEHGASDEPLGDLMDYRIAAEETRNQTHNGD